MATPQSQSKQILADIRTPALQRLGDFVDDGAIDRLPVIERSAHARMLRALTGKQKDDFRRGGGDFRRRSRGAQAGDGPGAITRHDSAAMLELAPPRLERESGVGQIDVAAFEMTRETFTLGGERRFRSSRKHEKLAGARRLRCGERRRLFNDDMRVGAADLKDETRSGAARTLQPGAQLGVHKEGRRGEVDLRIRFCEIDLRRQDFSSRASAVLMSPMAPEETSRWPRLAFTDPIAQYCVASVSSR